MSNNQPEYLTPLEVADLLRKPEATLRQWRWRKYGPKWSKFGKSVRYKRADVLAWADEQELKQAMG